MNIDKLLKGKHILDAACSSRMFWFNKNHPETLYVDKRSLKETLCDGRKININPDLIADFRNLPFPDKSFKLVIFDPPHLKSLGENSWMAKKYGVLNKNTWKEDLTKGFSECWRVLDIHGSLVFKWSTETETRSIPFKEVLSLFCAKPLFGHPTAKSGRTMWCVFFKSEDVL